MKQTFCRVVFGKQFFASVISQNRAQRLYNGLSNICFLVSQDNTRIRNRRPRKYLQYYKDQNKRAFSQAMKSHLIPVGMDSGVWFSDIPRGFKAFRAERLKLICAAFEREAGMNLFKRT